MNESGVFAVLVVVVVVVAVAVVLFPCCHVNAAFCRSVPVPQSDLAWLDALTCDLSCPTVLMPGNQQNVLMFYCQ